MVSGVQQVPPPIQNNETPIPVKASEPRGKQRDRVTSSERAAILNKQKEVCLTKHVPVPEEYDNENLTVNYHLRPLEVHTNSMDFLN